MNHLPEAVRRYIQPEPMSGCWLWSGGLSTSGYGKAYDPAKGKTVLAHRYVYELVAGAVSKPMLDHKCRVRCCVNPAHLRPATPRENALAPGSLSPAKTAAERAACPRCGGSYRQKARQRHCPRCQGEAARRSYDPARARARYLENHERYAQQRELNRERKREYDRLRHARLRTEPDGSDRVSR